MTFDCPNIYLKNGNMGEKVKELQTILKQKGFYGGIIDGKYGPLTVDAVKKLQRTQGNSTDGEFGPKTCAKLQATNTTTTETNTISDFKTIAGKKFLIADIDTAAKTFRQHIKNNKNYPNYLTIHDSNGNKYNIGRSAYMGLFEDVSLFAVKNGRKPNYVVAGSTANNALVIDYQNNGVNCGPASTSMCMQMFATWVSEPTLASVMGTNKYGTGPAAILNAVKKYGFEFQEISRDITSVKKALNEGSPVLMHINTAYFGGKSCLGYYNEYGHYIMCYGTNGTKYLLADPTKGFKTCESTSIDKAKSSSNMKYYRLNIA